MKKFKTPHPTERMLIFITLLIIALLVSVIWFYGERINVLWQQNGNGSLLGQKQVDNVPVDTNIKFYIHTALKSLYNAEPVTDISQQRVYFPELRIYVPYSNYARTVVYRYNPSDGVPESLELTSSANTNQLPVTFDDVPCLQRHVSVIVNSKSNFDGEFVQSLQMSDGRTLNLYRQDSKACSNDRWSQGSPDKLITLLKQAKSY